MAVSPKAFSRLAAANFAAFLIIATGAAVRLTGSGLGCPDWPNCYQHRFVAPLGRLNSVIEDANRLLTGLLVVLVVVTVLAALARRPRRTDLVWLSVGLLGGVVAAAIQGAVVVYTKLGPWFVSSHLALSLALLVLAAVLHHRSRYQYGEGARREVRCAWTLTLSRWLWLPLSATLLAGMATTGSGPHPGGNIDRSWPSACPSRCTTPRGCTRRARSASSAWSPGRTSSSSTPPRRAEWSAPFQRLLIVSAAQGVLGIVQYLTHLPVALVELHVIAAASITVGVLHFQLSQVARDREIGVGAPDVARVKESPLVPL